MSVGQVCSKKQGKNERLRGERPRQQSERGDSMEEKLTKKFGLDRKAIVLEPEPALTEEERREIGRRELYAYVWAAMDACNSSGLIHSFPSIVDRIREFEGITGSDVNTHPIVILMADKLLQLAGCANWHQKISHAYEDVLAVVKPGKGGDYIAPIIR